MTSPYDVADCPTCSRTVRVNVDGKLRKHKLPTYIKGTPWRAWCPNQSPQGKRDGGAS